MNENERKQQTDSQWSDHWSILHPSFHCLSSFFTDLAVFSISSEVTLVFEKNMA